MIPNRLQYTVLEVPKNATVPVGTTLTAEQVVTLCGGDGLDELIERSWIAEETTQSGYRLKIHNPDFDPITEIEALSETGVFDDIE